MNITPPPVPFLESSPDLTAGALALLGIPYEGTACFRKGTARGPDAIREISDGLESYSPRLDRDLAALPFADLGNMTLPGDDPEHVTLQAREACRELLVGNATPVLLGGEHSFTPGAVAAAHQLHPDLAVLQFDAHADLREEWTGTRWSHACSMRRILDFLPSERLLQCGIRSGTAAEFAELRDSGRLVAPDPIALTEALPRFDGAPLYVTLDLDLFDPSLCPGTGTPEPGGIDWLAFESLLAVIPWPRVVACDLVELAPGLDPTGCSTVLA
nr:agmatinase [Akkermansiaceae bacterium]